MPQSFARPAIGSIRFEFENLYLKLESGERRVFGYASIGFGGGDRYWPLAITLYGSEPSSPEQRLTIGTSLWREITRRLAAYHDENIRFLIAQELMQRGMHMAMFDENPPPAVTPLVSPHVSAAQRGATVLQECGRLVGEGVALFAFLSFIALSCLWAESLRQPMTSPHPVVAALEAGDGH